ncbi:MAG TPA: PEP-CTERM sorting domain-containing protein [Terriglobales bacterium]
MTRTHRSVLLLAGLLAFMAVSASAGTIIWGGTPDYGGYFVDPASGTTLPAPGGILTFGASSSPYGGWVFVTTPINIWKVPVMAAGNPQALGSCLDCGDLAFDTQAGALYAIGPAGQLYTVDYSCPFFDCTPTPLGVNMPGVQGIDFVSGRGLYGADINGLLWFLDPKTLQLKPIGDTGVFGITDLGYDSLSQRLIAVSVGIKCFQCGPQSGMIWSINPLTAQAVLLNDNAPAMYGLAEITPEPGSMILFATGAAGLLASMRRRLR